MIIRVMEDIMTLVRDIVGFAALSTFVIAAQIWLLV